MACNYPDREHALVSSLYDDGDVGAAERVAFEAHVTTCLDCRSELADLRGVRTTLGDWVAPDAARAGSRQSSVISRQSRGTWWHHVPVWAQVAAAVLVLGVSASIANLHIRYGRDGLNVTTGWSKPAVQPAQDAPWRAELASMRQQLQSEMRVQAASARAASAPPQTSDADVLRRVRLMLDESEKNQQKELALRLTQLQVDVNAQLDADRRRLNDNFRDVTNTYNKQILRQQQQINYLLPASLR